jgi:hypothetical protein
VAAGADRRGHLAKLRLAGLVRGRREGTFVYYFAIPAERERAASVAKDHVVQSRGGRRAA